MRINFLIGIIFFLFAFQNADAQSKPDILFLTDGSVQRVVVRGQNASRNLLQYTLWGSSSDRIISRDLNTVHKVVYSYGLEKVFNPSEGNEEDSNILDELFGGVEGIEEEELSVPSVENIRLLLNDETDTRLDDFSWTKDRLKLLRPSRFKKSRSRRYNSSYQPIPQWEEIDLPYVKGILLPGRIRLHVIPEAMETINDSTGWIEMRNGLKYAAQSIEIRDRKVTFEEYYTKKVFQWDAADVNFLVWEDQKGGIDFLRPGEMTTDGGNNYDSDSRGMEDEGDSFEMDSESQGGGGVSPQGSSSRNTENYSLQGIAEEFSPLPFPMLEPSTILRTRINSPKISSSSNSASLFSKGTSGDDIGEVKARLEFLFEEKNYQNLRYFPIQGGFVMLTPVEKFNDDGSTASFYKRFNIQAKAESSGNFEELVKNISFREAGYYRMFAVAVTDIARPYGENSITRVKGKSELDKDSSGKKINSKHKLTFMVYEWSQVKSGEKANLKERGDNKFSAYNHLKFAGILDLMKK